MKFFYLSLVHTFLLIVLYCFYGSCAPTETIQQVRRNKRSFKIPHDPNDSTGEAVEKFLEQWASYEHTAIHVTTTATPTTEPPTTAAPTTAAPTTAAPTSAAPTSAAPTTAAPTSAAPTSAAPTTAAPTTAAPTTEALTTPVTTKAVSKTTRSLDEVMRPYYPFNKK
ncbi:Hypothetical protein SRAE_2000508500 [Strongyloides ratti]|uniref:Uncharacterized protein n=1 Tax=Strongyloides ratti TaxID=34506 RepID=A0A090LKU6_STRRB|nr:Hypothetical protein SRAE_2000508500 [Strongyloides ratti]CEF70454.1 Hypothetical protein SRAE_2000508500 [Strongyloides ratti]